MTKMELFSKIDALQYTSINNFKDYLNEIENQIIKCYIDLVSEDVCVVTKNSYGVYYLFYLNVVNNKKERCLGDTIPDIFKMIQDKIENKQSNILIDLEDEAVDFIYMLNKYGYDNAIQYKV